MEINLILLIIAVIITASIFRVYKKNWLEIIIIILYGLSFPLFLLGLMLHGEQYDIAIDPVDAGYIPLGKKHAWSMLFYFIAYQISVISLWIKGRKLPPLYAVLCLIFIFIGIVLNIMLLIQIYTHIPAGYNSYANGERFIVFYPTIVLSLIIGGYFIIKMITKEKEQAIDRVFKNRFLNDCNQFLLKRFNTHTWAIIFMLPVLFIVTLILMLFGQDFNSLVKVFTETATWTFSQHVPPPPLDHQGHYLCTVSAKGSPTIVKPIGLGKRGGRTIIVNRQLQIANAFEELVQDFSPKLHRFIRHNYDTYGYNLSKKINTERASNLTYLLMKPLEWFFLIILYLGIVYPEKKIKKQYNINQ